MGYYRDEHLEIIDGIIRGGKNFGWMLLMRLIERNKSMRIVIGQFFIIVFILTKQ